MVLHKLNDLFLILFLSLTELTLFHMLCSNIFEVSESLPLVMQVLK